MLEVLPRAEDNSVMLSASPPTGKADCPEARERASLDGMANLAHQPQIIRHVVQRQQGRAEHFIHVKEVMQVGSTEVATDVARAIGLEWLRIPLMPGIPEF